MPSCSSRLNRWIVSLCALFHAADALRPTVSFRLDDVQPWWCEEIVKAIVDEFLSQGVPLNLGLIGNAGAPLSTGINITKYLAQWATNPMIEMVSHSNTHVSYAYHEKSWQKYDLKDGNDEMELVTGIKPTSFIPPLNEFNEDTAYAMYKNDMEIMSPSCVWSATPGVPIFCPSGADVVAPNIVWKKDVSMLPAGAVLGGDAYWSDYCQPADSDLAIEWIERQIVNQGFSVVMLHPAEFATDKHCSALNDKFIQLREVFAYGADKWDFKLFTDQKNAIISGSDTPTAAPTKGPPGPPPNCSAPLSANSVTTTSGDTSTTVTTVTSETHQVITTTVCTTTTEVVATWGTLSSSSSSGSDISSSALYMSLIIIGSVFGAAVLLFAGRKVLSDEDQQKRESTFSTPNSNNESFNTSQAAPSLHKNYSPTEKDFKDVNPLSSTADNRARVRRQSSSTLSQTVGALVKTPSQYEELGTDNL